MRDYHDIDWNGEKEIIDLLEEMDEDGQLEFLCDYGFWDVEELPLNTQHEAEQFAKDWQNWISGQATSYEECIQWQEIFEELGKRFDLTEEFKENGII